MEPVWPLIAWTALGGAAITSIAAHALLKQAGLGGGKLLDPRVPVAALLFVTGLPLLGLALQVLPMVIAYPVLIGVNMVAVAIVGRVRFGDRLRGRQALGVVLIFAGLVCLAVSAT